MGMIRVKLNGVKSIAELNIEDKITFITGDSGTGKTLLIDELLHISKSHESDRIQGMDIEQLLVFRDQADFYEYIAEDGDFTRKIVFIDRYDKFSIKAKEQLFKAMKTYQNIYILMGRYIDLRENYGFTMNSIKELETIEKQTKTGIVKVIQFKE